MNRSATQAESLAAFVDYASLCFPGQKISAADQVRFAAIFGKADGAFRPPSAGLATTNTTRGVMLVSNIRKNGKQIGSLPDGEMQFHSDGAHRDDAIRVLLHFSQPGGGGQTPRPGTRADRLDDLGDFLGIETGVFQ